ncbi:hypothetical protein PAPYR_10710 [Paratrimastix pyriformis]|uniref:Uncharacterized protein n=1 Tax=Paratrimastix pyriformis TaxID=342808 RepID=A0ABQ8U5C3_9EUKA|nr:hypothetical protein PAPYR_10710 [Paratrimastix pyriformis]
MMSGRATAGRLPIDTPSQDDLKPPRGHHSSSLELARNHFLLRWHFLSPGSKKCESRNCGLVFIGGIRAHRVI